MIAVQNLSKTFGSTQAVSNLSFETKTGEIIGFLGPNGAGKTTTMRLILGYLKPSSGSVSVLDQDPIKHRLAVLKQVGYLAENNPLYGEMKVNEYLAFIAKIKNVTDYEQLIPQVGLGDVLNKKIENLSRGYKQRVGLAAALIGDPKVFILDEPTSGLDPIEQDKIRNLIKALAKQKIVIFSSHILSEVEDIASRLVIINHGKLVHDGAKPKGKGAVEKLFRKLIT